MGRSEGGALMKPADVERGAELARNGTYLPGANQEFAADLPQPGEEVLLPDVGDERPVYPSPSAPLDVARKLFAAYRDPAGLRTLVSWRGTWMRWTGQHWAELDTAKLRAEVYDVLGGVDYMRPIREKGVVVDYERTAWDPNKRKVSDVLEAMSAVGHLGVAVDPPSWIEGNGIGVDAAQTVSCTNGILNLLTRTVSEHTPALFNVVSVPFAYDAQSGPPVAWLEFLNSVWPDDPDQVALLQEYVGYIISGRTDMQKMLLLVGPSRSGKGTIARMVTSLVGRGHVAGPTLASLGTNFGLAPLLGKPLAIISDARLGSTPAHTIVERLLSITGEDMLTVDRKFREPWSGKLPTRFVVLSNELPRFRDSSGAIANRLLIAQMTTSFLGREDRDLDRRLHAELPAILRWALDGLDRLTRNGRFTVPGSSEDAAALMMDLASPMSAFVRECCVRDPAGMVERDRLYMAWRVWCEDNGHMPGAKSSFGRDLRAVAPDLRDTQPRTGGVRVRYYERIRLCSTTDNAEYPVPPVPPDETAGHDPAGGTGHPVPEPVPEQPMFTTAEPGTGDPVPPAEVNPQVKAGGTGGTGQTPFKALPGSGTTDVACSVCAAPIPESLTSARKRGTCSRCTSTATANVCVHCGRRVTAASQTDTEGRPAHLSCITEAVTL